MYLADGGNYVHTHTHRERYIYNQIILSEQFVPTDVNGLYFILYILIIPEYLRFRAANDKHS